MTPEQQARKEIDRLLTAAGWAVQDVALADIHAVRGVWLREIPLAIGNSFEPHLLYVCPKRLDLRFRRPLASKGPKFIGLKTDFRTSSIH